MLDMPCLAICTRFPYHGARVGAAMEPPEPMPSRVVCDLCLRMLRSRAALEHEVGCVCTKSDPVHGVRADGECRDCTAFGHLNDLDADSRLCEVELTP